MTKSSDKIPCNSVEIPFMSCLKTLNILVLKFLRCLSVNDCFKGYPPKVMPISRVNLFNSLMNFHETFKILILNIDCGYRLMVKGWRT